MRSYGTSWAGTVGASQGSRGDGIAGSAQQLLGVMRHGALSLPSETRCASRGNDSAHTIDIVRTCISRDR
ncbi:hypothetical protein DPEC_G00314450 [Dallia pectoralis]|uniref:Uncharacterized protein n=1 Tax=Dallia pectoralis TaxID=75939 RepID=A0ACC2FC73_DALPE|nr:hypothetical protein DPEC_G00314450 [Dallia pectoralis]